LQDGEFNETTDSFSNAVYIGGKGQGDERDIYEGEDGSPEGLERFESWDDQSSLTDESEYENEAKSMLAQYGDITTVAGTALAKNPYVYKENYNVGDIIKISFSGKSANTRVLSVTEHWSGRGEYAIEFEFGKPMNNLANQLQLMLRQIQRAGDNSSSTDSVRWYTIPTDTEMPKADVTFDTIGFIGDAGAGATFKLYYNSNGTGSKTYHVYFKQLAGTGKLTLTTGVGAFDLVVSVGTYVMIIYVDENGNISTQGSTPVNTVTAGNTQPVTSGAVSSAIGSAVSGMKRQMWGTATISNSFGPWGGYNITVFFDTPLLTNNYNVQLILSTGTEYWTGLRLLLNGKYQNRFVFYVYNDSEHTINAGVKYDWLVTY
jgi:hypothetical protein